MFQLAFPLQHLPFVDLRNNQLGFNRANKVIFGCLKLNLNVNNYLIELNQFIFYFYNLGKWVIRTIFEFWLVVMITALLNGIAYLF